MRKDLEARLWDAMRPTEEFKLGAPPHGEIAKMLTDGVITNPKQAWRTLEKWERKGLYEYGVSIDFGWRRPPSE